jgi:hypothetical protein
MHLLDHLLPLVPEYVARAAGWAWCIQASAPGSDSAGGPMAPIERR